MFRLWIENEEGTRLELTNSASYTVQEIDGLLSPDVAVNSTEAVNMDGSKYNSSKVKDRPLTITILPEYPVEENRQRLYNFFKVKKGVTVYFQNKNREVKIEGRFNKMAGSLFDQRQTLIIDIICNDPYFKDKDNTFETMAQIESMFEFPFAIEKSGIEFSVINKTITKDIYNAGDVQTGMIITLKAFGTVVNPIIYDVNTREFFGINISMVYGDIIQINTNRGNKRVEFIRDNVTSNIINSMKKGSKWLQIQTGDNLFTYNCEEGAENLYINFEFANLYEGV